MKRRLYFLLPDTKHTHAVVNDLKVSGIDTETMHTLSNDGRRPGVASGAYRDTGIQASPRGSGRWRGLTYRRLAHLA